MKTVDMLEEAALPGGSLDTKKMPGHWLLARLGKRVLRPGGLRMTQELLGGLEIHASDDVVEFAPGLGVTARAILQYGPRSYIGVDRDAAAAEWTRRHLPSGNNISVTIGAADDTGLADGAASVVLGEAMLSMNTQKQKESIVAEAYRILRSGGRYGIHELCVVPDDIPEERRQELDRALSSSIHVGARPLPAADWKALLEGAGFRVAVVRHAPMDLLRPGRLIEDEGLAGALVFLKNILLDGSARHRVLEMRGVFERYRAHLGAIALVAEK